MLNILQADLSNRLHAQSIVRLLDEYARGDMGGNCGLADFVKENLVAELHKRPGVHAFLAFHAEDPAGLAICFEGFSTFACKPLLNIHDLMVSKPYRGLGISKQLLLAIETKARALGCCKVTLEVLEGNRIAQLVYTACGYSAYQLDPKVGKALFWQRMLDD